MYQDPFEMYSRINEPSLVERLKIWQTAIGLQGVDQLKTSAYLNTTAAMHMEGSITLYDVHERIKGYYDSKPQLQGTPEEEADKVAVQIAILLSEDAFTLSATEYLSIHKLLFSEIYDHAGSIRNYNITKKEWILREESVIYGNVSTIRETLEYDIKQEKEFDYKELSKGDIILHLAKFISDLWQVHAFEEGNTRTTAVFFIKYLRTKGFDVGNEIFAENAWYFRNALVRANYSDLRQGIPETNVYIVRFLENLLDDTTHLLSNRTMHLDYDKYIGNQKVNIGAKKVNIEIEKVNIGTEKVNIGAKKVNIGSEKVNIETEKVNIGAEKVNIGAEKVNIGSLSEINVKHFNNLRSTLEKEEVFGRKEVQEITGLGATRSSQLIQVLLKEDIIEIVLGYGKSKYKFVE